MGNFFYFTCLSSFYNQPGFFCKKFFLTIYIYVMSFGNFQKNFARFEMNEKILKFTEKKIIKFPNENSPDDEKNNFNENDEKFFDENKIIKIGKFSFK